MSKITYASLKLKTKSDIKTFDFAGNTIEVLQYLPIEQKYDLVMVALQNSKEKDIYNPIKLDMYMQLYTIYMYTNLTFTEKQKEEESKLYDVLMSNGFIDMVIENIPEEEYNLLNGYANELIAEELEYSTTAASAIRGLVSDLPKQADAMKNILDTFDPAKFKEVMTFAKAANGGNEI